MQALTLIPINQPQTSSSKNPQNFKVQVQAHQQRTNMTTIDEIISRYFILLFSMPFNFLKLSLSHFKWVLEFLVYHPFYSLHHHQPLQEFQILTEDEEPVEIWHPREGEEEVDCAVCLNKVGEGDEVRVLRCEHVFHRECLNQWVGLRNFTCPLCRDFLGSRNRVVNGSQAHVLFLKFSSFSDNSDERDNWWLR